MFVDAAVREFLSEVLVGIELKATCARTGYRCTEIAFHRCVPRRRLVTTASRCAERSMPVFTQPEGTDWPHAPVAVSILHSLICSR
jgi:hypothetical protein